MYYDCQCTITNTYDLLFLVRVFHLHMTYENGYYAMSDSHNNKVIEERPSSSLHHFTEYTSKRTSYSQNS